MVAVVEARVLAYGLSCRACYRRSGPVDHARAEAWYRNHVMPQCDWVDMAHGGMVRRWIRCGRA